MAHLPDNKSGEDEGQGKKAGPAPKVRDSSVGLSLTVVLIWAFIIFSVALFFLVFLLTGIKEEPPVPPKKTYMDASLYFLSPRGDGLSVEKRDILSGGGTILEAHRILDELLKGPAASTGEDGGDGEYSRPHLGSAIPDGTRILSIKRKGATLIVDISGEIQSNHPGGSSGEIQTIYSIVNSLITNLPSVDRVQLLIDGELKKTLAGHIEILLPLKERL